MLAEKRTTGNMRHVQLADAIGSVLPDGGASTLFGLRSLVGLINEAPSGSLLSVTHPISSGILAL
ncbi:hypothetical protein JYY36_002360 [Salmonella enterica subsp. diarizonae serovar 50:z:-]|nr:hypothetical protein [Salmonella enterica]EDC7489516.1 hypothetical protein [Salmonella enterica]EHC2386348.1 hypothetical protein [Salmonella enterica]EHC9775219.1 hypothetical protein [Salmonella enterica subsp. diarizonae serovar 50:z:-]